MTDGLLYQIFGLTNRCSDSPVRDAGALAARIDRAAEYHDIMRKGLGAEPVDLARKIEKAMSMKGPRMLIALSPCPTGWDYDPQETVTIGKLAVKTGIWPLKEYINGKVIHTKIPREKKPVEDYLKLQD